MMSQGVALWSHEYIVDERVIILDIYVTKHR